MTTLAYITKSGIKEVQVRFDPVCLKQIKNAESTCDFCDNGGIGRIWKVNNKNHCFDCLTTRIVTNVRSIK